MHIIKASSRAPFTRREHQVLELVSQGCTDKEIAARLGISRKTVEAHLQRIFMRHGLHNRASAIAIWLRVCTTNVETEGDSSVDGWSTSSA
jgi:DNA-binding CsgD family transcriptional regulator